MKVWVRYPSASLTRLHNPKCVSLISEQSKILTRFTSLSAWIRLLRLGETAATGGKNGAPMETETALPNDLHGIVMPSMPAVVIQHSQRRPPIRWPYGEYCPADPGETWLVEGAGPDSRAWILEFMQASDEWGCPLELQSCGSSSFFSQRLSWEQMDWTKLQVGVQHGSFLRTTQKVLCERLPEAWALAIH